MSLAIQAVSAGFSIANTAATTSRSQMLNRRVTRELDNALWSLQPMYQAMQGEHKERSNILGVQEGRSLFDNMRAYSGSMAKSGFDTSGALQNEANLGKQSIYDSFGEKRYDLEIQRQSQINNLASQERNLLIQRAGMDRGSKGAWSGGTNADYESYKREQARQEYLKNYSDGRPNTSQFDDPYLEEEDPTPPPVNVDANGNYVPHSDYEDALAAQGKTTSSGTMWDNVSNSIVVGAEKVQDAVTSPLWMQQHQERKATAQAMAPQIGSAFRNAFSWMR